MLESPSGYSVFSFNIVGSCNGLCLLESLYPGNLFLWNPSIRKIVKLPPSLTPVTRNVPKLPSIIGTTVGFGFDQRSHDSKVVKIGYLVDYKSGLDVPWTVEIYFLSTHSWRRSNCVADFCSEAFFWVHSLRLQMCRFIGLRLLVVYGVSLFWHLIWVVRCLGR